MTAIITLTTDFGTRDGYVAAMKGVILSIAPRSRIIDVTHDIPAQNIAEAAFVIASVYRYYPPGTVHVIVVDPGVGTDRRALAVETAHGRFVLPDNGLLTPILLREKEHEAVSLTARRHWRTPDSSATFHGRDIFAPCGAHLAQGVPLQELGTPAGDLHMMDIAEPVRTADGATVGQIQHVDRFGNMISNIPAELVRRIDVTAIVCRGVVIAPLHETYGQVAEGQLVALIGSHGYLEIAVRNGSARQELAAAVGDPIRLESQNH